MRTVTKCRGSSPSSHAFMFDQLGMSFVMTLSLLTKNRFIVIAARVALCETGPRTIASSATLASPTTCQHSLCHLSHPSCPSVTSFNQQNPIGPLTTGKKFNVFSKHRIKPALVMHPGLHWPFLTNSLSQRLGISLHSESSFKTFKKSVLTT